MNAASLPHSLVANPRLSSWIRFNDDRTVTIYSGKVELGQGIGTALAQIAADELDVPLERLRMVSGDTLEAPDELWTSASISIEVGGSSIRLVCAEVRALFLVAASGRLEAATTDLVVNEGTIEVAGTGRRTSYWDLAPFVDLDRSIRGTAQLKKPSTYRYVGRSVPRRDLAAKLSGAGFVHDLERPGMLHGRVLRPPAYSARLLSIDRDRVAAASGVRSVFVDGSFVGVCAEREEQALKALEIARDCARWTESADLPEHADVRALLAGLPGESTTISLKTAPPATRAARLKATYTKPYIAHGSIGPACAVAELRNGRLTVWSHSQGVYPLRDQLAKVMDMAQSAVTVIHRDGAGCYGHNGADDVALDAALLARAAGRPVKVVWTRDDELAWSPFGPAMAVELSAAIDSDGRISDWRHEAFSTTHLTRPGWGQGVSLLAARHLERPFPQPSATDPPLEPWGGGGDRNAIPLYEFGSQEVIYHFKKAAPLRTSALRSLGAYANVFAIESFIDELAALRGLDPVALRIAHLEDERARAVIEAVARLAGWAPAVPADEGRGQGIGFARYKNKGSYCAIVVEIEVREAIRVERVFAAVDAGLVVNPDGVRNQIEGGIVQSISWTLKERVVWDRHRVLSRSWKTYPILRFDEAPRIEVELIERREEPSLGVGECAAGPTAAAIANALCRAMGVRVRDLPLTAERIVAAM